MKQYTVRFTRIETVESEYSMLVTEEDFNRLSQMRSDEVCDEIADLSLQADGTGLYEWHQHNEYTQDGEWPDKPVLQVWAEDGKLETEIDKDF